MINRLTPFDWKLPPNWPLQRAYDSSTVEYVNYVERDGGAPMSYATINNINTFVKLCKDIGAWDKLQLALSAQWGYRDNADTPLKWYSLRHLARYTQTNTPSRRPIYTPAWLNGQPAWRFDGGDDVLALQGSSSIFRNVPSATLVCVAQSLGSTGRRLFFFSGGASGGQARLLGDQVTTPQWRLSGRRLDADSGVGTQVNASVTVPTIVTTDFLWDSAIARIWANRGTPGQNLSWLTAGNTQDTASITSNIGADTTQALNGYLAVVTAFVPALTTAQRQAIENFFASSTTGFGITLT